MIEAPSICVSPWQCGRFSSRQLQINPLCDLLAGSKFFFCMCQLSLNFLICIAHFDVIICTGHDSCGHPYLVFDRAIHMLQDLMTDICLMFKHDGLLTSELLSNYENLYGQCQ